MSTKQRHPTLLLYIYISGCRIYIYAIQQHPITFWMPKSQYSISIE